MSYMIIYCSVVSVNEGEALTSLGDITRYL